MLPRRFVFLVVIGDRGSGARAHVARGTWHVGQCLPSMAAGNGRVRLEGIPAHVWAVAGILLLSLLYVILEVGVVRPRMPAGDEAATLPGVLLTRPPEIAADDPNGLSAIEDWRARYWSERTSAPRQGFSATHLPKILQVLVFVGSAIVLFGLRSNDWTASLCVL